jgi:hypothetical protein
MKLGAISAALVLITGAALLSRRVTPPAAAAPPAPAAASATTVPAATAAPEAEAEETPPVRRVTSWRSGVTPPLARVAEAETAKLAVVKGLFATARVAFPPAQILLRGFKKEKRLELWASSKPGATLSHVTTYEVCMMSGDLGPKRQEGDGQVPEGFYTLTEYAPATPFYLAMQVSYPNLSDRILGDKRHPGTEIMIHGRCVSIGCLAMSDERIQEIWLASSALRSAGGVVHMHLFPSRDMAGITATAESPELRAFWKNLAEGFDFFEAHRTLPTVRVDPEGRYHFH